MKSIMTDTNSNLIQILCKSPNSTIFAIEMNFAQTVSNLIQKIRDQKKWKQFTLFKGSRKLHPSQQLKDLNLQNGNQITAIFPLYGGSNKIKVIVSGADNQQHNAEIDPSMTGYQFKQYIYDNVTQSLGVNQMSITYAGVKIQNDKKLGDYKIIDNGGVLKIIQTKVGLQQVANIIIAYEQDPISCQNITARMPCGHVCGQQNMTAFIRSLIDAKKFLIRCPSTKPDGTFCQFQWDYQMCRNIGVFTAEQKKEFETGLSQNWIKQFGVECPSCRFILIKGDLKSDRVRCSNCNYGDFCAICLKKWISNNFEQCGHKDCKSVDDFLANSPQNVKFKLKDSKGIYVEYKLFDYRACPNCHVLINHKQACKHMYCQICKTNFCWVCLQVKQGNWKCGGAFDYCGKVAQPQKLNTD